MQTIGSLHFLTSHTRFVMGSCQLKPVAWVVKEFTRASDEGEGGVRFIEYAAGELWARRTAGSDNCTTCMRGFLPLGAFP